MDPDFFARDSGGSPITSPILDDVAPWYCFNQPRDPGPNGFNVGMLLAAENPRRQYDDRLIASPAKVTDVCGFRICCKFLKSNTVFWCTIDDERIHPLSEYVVSKVPDYVGTSAPARFFKRLCEPVDYLGGSPGSFEIHLPALLEGVHASEDLFLPKPEVPSRNMFQVGQRLEAVDPRFKDEGVFEAEIAEVISDKVKIHFIGYDDDKTFKYSSRDLFPVGFTAKTGQSVRCGPKGKGADGVPISRNRPVTKRVSLKSEEPVSSNGSHFAEIMANVIAQSTTSSALKRASDEYREDHFYGAKKCKKAERVNEPLVDLLTGDPIVDFKVPLVPPIKRPRGRPRKIIGAGTPASVGTKPVARLAASVQSASIPLAVASTSAKDKQQSSKFLDKPINATVGCVAVSASQKQPELSQLINAFRNSAAAALILPVDKEHVAISSSTALSICNVSTANGTTANFTPLLAVSSKQPPPLIDPRSGTIIVEPQNFRCVFYVNHDSLCNLGPFLSRSGVDRMPFIFGPSCVLVVMPALYQALMNAVTDKHREEVLKLLPSVKIIGTSTINVACEHLNLAFHHHLPFYDDNESAAEGLAATLKKLGCCENFISNRPDLKCGVGEDNVHYHYSILEPLKLMPIS